MALTKVSSQMLDGVGSGGQNYIVSNPDAESSVFGWATYADGAAVPVDGTGGSPTATLTRSTSSPLRGVGSFLYTAGALGNGTSFAFTIDSADQAKLLQVSFNWAPSATIVDGDYTVYVYDVTNAVMSQVIPYKIGGGLSTGQYAFKGSFQSASNSTSYRLVINQAVATPGGNLKFDNVYVGVQPVSYSSPVTDWTAYTPTFAGFGTAVSINMYWRRIGDSVQITGNFVTGTPTAVAATIGLPTGLTADSTKSPNANIVGFVHQSTQAQGYSAIIGIGATAISVGLWATSGATNPFTPLLGNAFAGVGTEFGVNATVPIAGWSSSAAISQTDSTEGRIVSLRCTDTSGVAVNASGATFKFQTKTIDTHGAYSTATGAYTVPVTGYYSVKASLAVSGPIATSQAFYMSLQKNGSDYSILAQMWGNGVATGGQFISGGDELFCVAGDALSIYTLCNASTTAISSVGWNHLDITRISGNQSVLASESVNAFYGGTPTGTLSGAYNVVTYPTKIKDSHNAMSGSSYTIPVKGCYDISAQTLINGTYSSGNSMNLAFQVNGTNKYQVPAIANPTTGICCNSLNLKSYPLNAGDIVTIALYAPTGTGLVWETSGTQNFFSIARSGN